METTEFLAELDLGAAPNGAGIFNVDDIDLEAFMNNTELWNNIGGGWSDGLLDGQQPLV